jgi:GT2 family glycosyltransferase
MPTGSRILAVATLYQQSPTESAALSSLIRILQTNPQIASHFSLVVYDNSPVSFEGPMGITAEYVHDPANRGLAAAYNHALSRAERTGHEWLLLLDQDTTLTSEFLIELQECADSLLADENVAAIVPKLVIRGTIQSPAEHFIDYMRHQFAGPLKTATADVVGVQSGRISAYNSGSTLRVTALRSIGGFPEQFWLDYLDHAVFHALWAGNRQVYVLHAALNHDLAESDLNRRPLWRFRNVLRAQALFVKQAGGLGDRLLYRIWLLRTVRRLRADCKDPRIWKETAMQALLSGRRDATDGVRPPVSP